MRSTVLVVDDDPVVRRLVRMTLDQSPREINVVEAADGRAALRAMEQEHPDLGICDLFLPDMDGIAVCTRVKANPSTASIPFVLLTVAATGDEADRARAAGADAYLTKPFSPRALLDEVEGFLARTHRP